MERGAPLWCRCVNLLPPVLRHPLEHPYQGVEHSGPVPQLATDMHLKRPALLDQLEQYLVAQQQKAFRVANVLDVYPPRLAHARVLQYVQRLRLRRQRGPRRALAYHLV